jgi:hypothetical protein
MQRVFLNPNLVEKILQFCSTNLIENISKASTDNYTIYNTIGEFYWKNKCVDNYKAKLSWYDLYCALSNENNIKNKYLNMRKSYIDVANCCKCRVYCKSCAKPMSSADDVELKCPHCQEIDNIDEFEISHRSNDNVIINRGSVSYLCESCRKFQYN